MRYDEILNESDYKGMLTSEQVAEIGNFAEQGDRIVADGKTIWQGFGNSAGLYNVDELKREKWAKSGPAFLRKLAQMQVSVVQTKWYNAKDRMTGNWVTGKTFTFVDAQNPDLPKFYARERQYLSTIGSKEFGKVWNATFDLAKSILTSGDDTVVMTSCGHPSLLHDMAFGEPSKSYTVDLPDGSSRNVTISANGKMVVIGSNESSNSLNSLFMEPSEVDTMFHSETKK